MHKTEPTNCVTLTLDTNQVCHGVGPSIKNGSCSSSSLVWMPMDSIAVPKTGLIPNSWR